MKDRWVIFLGDGAFVKRLQEETAVVTQKTDEVMMFDSVDEAEEVRDRCEEMGYKGAAAMTEGSFYRYLKVFNQIDELVDRVSTEGM